MVTAAEREHVAAYGAPGQTLDLHARGLTWAQHAAAGKAARAQAPLESRADLNERDHPQRSRSHRLRTERVPVRTVNATPSCHVPASIVSQLRPITDVSSNQEMS